MNIKRKSEYIGALGALLVHVAIIALLILVSFTVPQPDEDAGGVPVMLGNVESARGFDDPSLVDVDILPEEPEAPAPAETQPELPSEQDLLTQTEEETVVLKPKTEPKKETVKPKEVVKPKEPVKKPEKTEAEKAAEAKRLAEEKAERERKAAEEAAKKKIAEDSGYTVKMLPTLSERERRWEAAKVLPPAAREQKAARTAIHPPERRPEPEVTEHLTAADVL
mgnify:CR=1 FL=1